MCLQTDKPAEALKNVYALNIITYNPDPIEKKSFK